MGFSDVFKALILPFLIAGAIYGTCAYIILPLYRKHHARYADYLPLQSISSGTSSLRFRLQRSFLPSFMRWRQELDSDDYGRDARYNLSRGVYRPSDDSDDELFGAEEGEVMVGFDFNRGRGRLPVRGGDGRVVGEQELPELDSNRRLSRELEEGFKDESEDEEEEDDRRG